MTKSGTEQTPMENRLSAIRDLYPDLSTQEASQAEETFERYLSLVLRIFDRLNDSTEK